MVEKRRKEMASQKTDIRKRMIVFYVIFLALILFLLGRTAYLQIFRGAELKEAAEQQQTRDSMITPKRGTIYDRNGKVLAQSASAEMVVVEPVIIKKEGNAAEVANALSQILELDYDDVYAKTQKNSYYEIVKKKLEKETADKIRELKLTGVRLDEDTKRYYPGGAFASHVIGFTGADNQGLAGIELVCDSYLKGTPGRIRTAKNANGTDMPFESEQYLDPVEGNDVVLTIDEVIQHFAEKHIENAWIDNQAIDGAAVIVMNPNTGEILAMATKPDYDLNSPMTLTDESTLKMLSEYEGEERDKKYSEELNRLWRNKAVVDTYEPGSTFKAVVAAAAIEENTPAVNGSFFCSGTAHVADWDIRCHKVQGHGSENFVQAVYNSCNPAFIEIGLGLGVNNFTKYFKAFGFTEKTGFDIPGEAVGSHYTAENMKQIDLAVNSFGQSFTITPLQMISAMSTIANGGNLMKPYLVKQVVDINGNVIKNTEPQVVRQVISENTSKTMRGILEGVVSQGGGKNAYIPGYRIAGKTGTSEKLPRGSGEYIASFVGFAPANNPQIAVLVLLDNPQGAEYYGGMIAAPVVGNIVNDTLRYLGVQPQYTEEELAKKDILMPDVTGMPIDAAKKIINQSGLKYTIVGDGDAVVDQTPKAGIGLLGGSVGVLYTQEGPLNKVMVPDLTGMSSVNCNIALANCGLNFRVSGPGKADSAGLALASSQDPPPGTEVDAGSIVFVEFRYVSAE